MRITITRDLKIILLKALKDGYIDTDELTEVLNINKNEIDISMLTENEKKLLFEISLKVDGNI